MCSMVSFSSSTGGGVSVQPGTKLPCCTPCTAMCCIWSTIKGFTTGAPPLLTSFNPLGLLSNWLLLPLLFNLLYKLCNSSDSSDDSHSIRACYFDKEGSRPCCEVIFQFQPAIGVRFNTLYNTTPCANDPELQSLVS